MVEWQEILESLNHCHEEERFQFSFLSQSNISSSFFFNISFLMQMKEQRKGEVGRLVI